MEVGSIMQFLDNKTILVTGALGFLAKIFVEKILRSQPNVKKLYLLLRAHDVKSAAQRLNDEGFEKELFRVIKEKQNGNFDSFVWEKVIPVPGDITQDDNLGILRKDLDDHSENVDLLEQILREVDVVVNLAATTNFDERYDVAYNINTLGAKHVLNFAKKCDNIKLLLHVSTAYVSGEKAGLIVENPYKMGETLNGVSGLDIDNEKRIVDEKLGILSGGKAEESQVTLAMKDLGMERARMYGWPNVYVFTKAMGEMLLGHFKGNLPVVIIRPTIVTSTYKEPFPGWVEGIRTIDSLFAGYCKGRLTSFLGDPKSIVDVIPADMVVNAMIVAMAAHVNEQQNINIYQVGSSVSHPIEYSCLQEYGQRYFTKHPWIGKDGKAVKVGKITVFGTMRSFQLYMTINYLLPLKGLELVNAIFCQYFQGMYMELSRKIKFVMRLIDIYHPYLFFKGIYDDINTEKLRRAARGSSSKDEAEMFYFDPKCINWENYFINIHLPGVVKYVFK
ncbi:alcohol-forming fatty acyl-CoA reductase-like [Impatiens glandulifera]|uniref:alcohol-forming fatty acyl-CoA reductase-like n=1 Tax=Impatiens glandulifera TaxID=253017 RepID=UPI001FB0E199|nr:alcohol-forming fatty acyl-CoA reductase-like [Impatiens glandulifera]